MFLKRDNYRLKMDISLSKKRFVYEIYDPPVGVTVPKNRCSRQDFRCWVEIDKKLKYMPRSCTFVELRGFLYLERHEKTMTLSPFVFSNNPRYRVARHVLFWTAWVLYYTIFQTLSWPPKYSFGHRFIESLMEEGCFGYPLTTWPFAIPSFISCELPQYLQKGHYVTMVLLWLFFSVLFVAGSRFYTIHIVPSIRGLNDMPTQVHSMSFIWDFFWLFSQINMEGCIAASDQDRQDVVHQAAGPGTDQEGKS